VLMGMVCLERAVPEWGSMHWCDAEPGKETLGNLHPNSHPIHGTRENLVLLPDGQGNVGAPLGC